MKDVILVLCNFFHLTATVIWIGQAVLSGLIYMPLFNQQLKGPALGAMMTGMIKKAGPWIIASIFVFIATGIPLTLWNENVSDPTHPWSMMIYIKHAFVLIMIVLAVYTGRVAFPKLQKAMSAVSSKEATPQPQVLAAMKRMKIIGRIVTLLGLIVLLITAIAEVVA
jgi:uncharacterized membrane protein